MCSDFTLTDSELIEIIKGCVSNDRKAQEQLYALYYPSLLSYIKKYISYDNADINDIMNAAFLRIYKKIHQFDYNGSIEGWMKKIVYHSVCDYIRANKRSKNIIILDDDRINPVDNLGYKQIMKLFEELPNNTRKALDMHMEGYQHNHIAEVMGISVGTSKWHVSTGKEMLKEKLLKLNYI